MSERSSFPQRIATHAVRTGALYFASTWGLAQAFAQAFGGGVPTVPGTGTGNVRDTVSKALRFITTFLALVAIVFVVIGGIRILAAGGNDEQVQAGKKTIIYALVGLIIVFLARVIVNFITGELATNITN